MLTLFKSKESQNQALAEFKDPFNKSSVQRISIEIEKHPSMFMDYKCMKAVVYFKSGNTSGDQKFCSNDLQDLMNRVSGFINEL